MTHSEKVRANAVAILRAAKVRGKGWRLWSPVYPDTSNGVKAKAGRDPFGSKVDGGFNLWWSEFRTVEKGVEEIRKGLWSDTVRGKLRLKGEAFQLVTFAGSKQ